MVSVVQWFLADEKTLVEGALASLPCEVFTKYGRSLFEADNCPPSVRDAIFRSFSEHPSAFNSIRVYSEGIDEKFGRKNYEHFAVGVSSTGNWAPLTPNLSLPATGVLLGLCAKALQPQTFSDIIEKGRPGKLLLSILFLYMGLWTVLHPSNFQEWYWQWLGWMMIIAGVEYVVEHLLWRPVAHHIRRTKMLAAYVRFSAKPA
jgi:hypothetical protein